MKAILIKIAVLLIFAGTIEAQVQQKTFKLGFTGAYPQNYDYPSTSAVNWSWYGDLSMNMWSGWWIGETRPEVLGKLDSNHIDGMFEPDTIRWAGLGRQVILQAEDTTDRFSYDHHNRGTNYRDDTQWGSHQMVRYFEALPSGPYNPVTVLSGAKENTIQSFCAFPYDPMYQVHFPYNNYYYPQIHRDTAYINKYYIEPRMRINVSDANGQVKEVVKIIVLSYDGQISRFNNCIH